ncbi:uncharacterized protein LOC127000067 [Eriocheir sinensis]|uniref:uncharacterized protein LOC127000067 n=1 Tax=Eriocheir sinensis TaxID=95602 RepID=UPI0021CA6F2E|nr:uncharacterized protein LOC127000067 [Eriocheir sinensis]
MEGAAAVVALEEAMEVAAVVALEAAAVVALEAAMEVAAVAGVVMGAEWLYQFPTTSITASQRVTQTSATARAGTAAAALMGATGSTFPTVGCRTSTTGLMAAATTL